MSKFAIPTVPTVTEIFTPVSVTDGTTIDVASSQEELNDAIKAGWKTVPPNDELKDLRNNGVLTPENRKKLRDKGSKLSMRIPKELCVEGTRAGKVIQFLSKLSRNTGEFYVAAQIEVEGIIFCTLDNGDTTENQAIQVYFKPTTDKNIQSGFVCTYK